MSHHRRPRRRAPAPPLRRRALRLAEAATTPLLPADYLDLFAPLRAGADLRGRIVAVQPETADAATIVIRPGADWAGHVPGQYVRIGIDVDGVRQWRAYSLTHGPRADGRISITVKAVPDGLVSNHLVRERRPGTLVHLEQAAGEFVLADRRRQAAVRHRRLRHHPGHRDAAQPLPGHRRRRACGCRAARTYDIVVVHVAPSRARLDLPRDLQALDAAGAIRLVARYDDEHGVLDVADLDRRWCPTWPSARPSPAARPACSTPSSAHHDERGLAAAHRAVPRHAASSPARAAPSPSTRPAPTVEADGATPILDAAEDAGVLMPSGCRMGICFGCVLPLREGVVRDLRNGAITTAVPGETDRRRPDPDLHHRRRRRLPHRPLTRPTRPPTEGDTMTVIQKKPDNPIAHLTPEDIEAARRRARRDPPGRPRHPRRARRGVHPQGHRRPSASSSSAAAPCCCSRCSRRPGSSAPPACRVAKILENMEIGHNVLHGQWDWMRDPKIHSTTWEWDNASPGRAVEALAQRAAPHLHQRRSARTTTSATASCASTRTSRWHAVPPRPAAVELHQRLLLRVRHRGVRPRARRHLVKTKHDQGPGVPGARQAGAAARSASQATKDYVVHPLLSRPGSFLPHAGRQRHRQHRPQRVDPLGHHVRPLPRGRRDLREALDRGRDPRRVVRAPDARLGQHLRLARPCTS